uniref:Transcription elongation factor n=1 Tax=Anthurium amnicola TaxID=1678845 RepID=A0A1D1XUE1_9ARAE
MEKEILEIFAVAKRAGEAAAAEDGGSPEVTRCLDALRQLRKLPVTTKELVATKVGKGILCLTKHPQKKIQTVASELRQYWKDLVIEEATKNSGRKNIPEDQASPKVGLQSAKVATVKVEMVQKSGANSEALKFERNALHERVNTEKISEKETVNIKNSVKVESVKSERMVKVEKTTKEKQSFPIHPPKLTSMIKCNDELRDKFREIIAEALSRVQSEASEEYKDDLAACDPIRVAVSVESLMFEKLGRSNGTNKAKYRSIMFNMKDSKNPDLRRRVLLGYVKPAELITMPPEEMASDERKRQNQQIKDKAIFECERGGPAKATTDQFKCGRCGKRKTTYYQLQTRSADEPMTTYVTCVECNNHWKFC